MSTDQEGVEVSRSKLQLIRCKLNKYETPLFSFDFKGIYVKCKDCRTVDKEGSIKRGTFHLVTWAQLFFYMLSTGNMTDKMGVIAEVEVVHGIASEDSGSTDQRVEVNDSVDESSGG